jgi:O-antigen/teichoic acid export membrane protein
VDILVLEHYNYNVEIGYYELANRIVSLLMLPFIMFAQVIAPNITSKYSCGAYEYLRYRFKTYCLWTIVLSAGIAGLCYLVYPLIMKKFLNEYMVDNFIIMINVLLVLFVLRTLGAAIVTQGFATPTGHAYINMRILLFTGPLNLLLDVVLIKKFGFIGVVYATFIVLIINHTLLLTIYYLKVLKRGK